MNLLSNQDHENMDIFLKRILNAYKGDGISLEKAVAAVAHVMAALDNGDIGEVRSHFDHTLKFTSITSKTIHED